MSKHYHKKEKEVKKILMAVIVFMVLTSCGKVQENIPVNFGAVIDNKQVSLIMGTNDSADIIDLSNISYYIVQNNKVITGDEYKRLEYEGKVYQNQQDYKEYKFVSFIYINVPKGPFILYIMNDKDTTIKYRFSIKDGKCTKKIIKVD